MLFTPIKPMLLQDTNEISQSKEFVHQLKLDGHRALLHYQKGVVHIYTRHQNEITYAYPELHSLELPVDNCILDGEMVVLEPGDPPKPSFEDLMTRFHASNPSTIRKLMSSKPVHFSAFDIIYFNGKSLVHTELKKRLQLLCHSVTPSPFISVCPTYSDGNALYERVVEYGLEGIVSKNLNSKIHLDSRPSGPDAWYRKKNYQYATVAIAGIRKKEFGWLLQMDGEYKGIMEFVPRNERAAFYQISKKIVRKETRDFIYLDPLIKVKVKFQAYTRDGLMRTPSFVEFDFAGQYKNN